MGDALNALRPQRLRTKAASSLLPHWLDGYSECNSCSSRVLLAHVESANCPVAYQGLKITTSLSSVSMIFSERLNLVINNNRFLIFPWINVPNLASKALALVTKQIRNDWQTAHGYRPVLIETFVDDSQYLGTCYQAANWECIGKSSGKDWQDKVDENNRC
ncbi:Druantia anti-phage system protein DruA [Bathymodiolus platifrons methanotrophic gill symbiont]|uniref:Druantia anti-phage system protein DruA n=1 Tax=Bathymodiolus platifrons methanotrophic gill symbiont TaxID=113268 RepID=UPI001C8DD052|nr:Druantia anti-phage system protein DruA [Bathymodiolus platifrons methanotrophic gill symbiont]